MTTNFSYPSLRCIVEYLDPNKRIHIASRSPQLRLFDKSVPLRMSNLEINENGIEIDNCTYRLYEEYVKAPIDDQEPGDLPINPRYMYSSVKRVSISISCRKYENAPFGISKQDALKTLCETLLCYKSMYMWWLDIELDRFVELPLLKNLKVRTRNLSTNSGEFSDTVPFIDLKSLPMKNVWLTVYDNKTLKHPIVATSERLSIEVHRDIPIWMIQKLHNKYVALKQQLTMEQTISLINTWIRTERSLLSSIDFMLTELFDWKAAAERFGGVLKTTRDQSTRLLIPRGFDSQLVVSQYGTNGSLTIRVVSTLSVSTETSYSFSVVVITLLFLLLAIMVALHLKFKLLL